jgi:hypothetical protein
MSSQRPTGPHERRQGKGEAEAHGDSPSLIQVDVTAEPTQRPGPPRLKIAHLMLMTACSAVYLLLQRQWFSRGTIAASGAGLGFSIADAVLAGPALAAVFLWPAWQARRLRFPVHAGDYLLLFAACLVVLKATARTAILAADDTPYSSWLLLRFASLGYAFVAAAMCYVAFTHCWRRPLWGLVFCFYFASLVLTTAGNEALGLGRIDGWWLAVAALCWMTALTVAVISDIVARFRLPWTHWLGVTVFLLNEGVSLAEYVWAVYYASS